MGLSEAKCFRTRRERRSAITPPSVPLTLPSCCSWYLEIAHGSCPVQSCLIHCFSSLVQTWGHSNRWDKTNPRNPWGNKTGPLRLSAFCSPGTKFTVALCPAVLAFSSILPRRGPQYSRSFGQLPLELYSRIWIQVSMLGLGTINMFFSIFIQSLLCSQYWARCIEIIKDMTSSFKEHMQWICSQELIIKFLGILRTGC